MSNATNVGASQRTLHARSRDCSPVPRYLPRWRGKVAAGLRQAAVSPLARCADLGPHPLRLRVAPRRVPPPLSSTFWDL